MILERLIFKSLFRSPAPSAHLPIGIYCSWVWRKWSLDIHLLSWTPLPSVVNSHGILPWRSVKRPKLALMKSRVAILFLALLSTCGLQNSMISWSLSQGCPNPHISNQTFLVCSARSSSTSFLIGCICIRSYCQCFPGISWIVCSCVVPPAGVRVVPHGSQGCMPFLGVSLLELNGWCL